MRRFASPAVSLAAATVCAQLVLAAELVVATHNMPVSRFSEVALAISLGMVGALVFDFGSNLYSVRELASGSTSEKCYAERLFCKLSIAVTLSGAGIFLCRVLGPNAILVGGLALFFAQVAVQAIAVPFRAKDMASTPAWFGVASRSGGLVFLLTVDAVAQSPHAVLATLVCQDLLALVGTAAEGGRRGLLRGTRPAWRNPWAGSCRYGVASLGVGMAQLDIVVLGAAGGASAAGVYGAVNRWIQPFNMLAASVAITITPSVAKYPTWTRLWQVIRSHRLLLVTASIGGVGVAVSSHGLVNVLLGDGYEEAAWPLSLLGLGAAFAVWSQPLAASMQALGREGLVSWLLPSVNAARLILIAVSADVLSASAAAGAYLVSQAVILMVLSVAVFRGLSAHGEHRRDCWS